jgi:hypothetical protein
MPHLAHIVEPCDMPDLYAWTIFNRYTGAELHHGHASSHAAADADARHVLYLLAL